MAPKKVTILLVPDGAGRVKQVRISRPLAISFMALIGLCVAALVWTVHAYTEVQAKIPRMAQLQRENLLQKEQILLATQRIEEVSREMAALREIDRQIKGMIDLDEVKRDEQCQGRGGSDPGLLDPKTLAARVDRELVQGMHRSLDHLEMAVEASREDKTDIKKFLEDQKTVLASTPSIWPAKGSLSSAFGYRNSPFTGEKEFHRGIDISTRTGALVVASADGTASFTGWEGGYGRVVVIRHGQGLETKYAHLKKSFVKKGQHVKKSQPIGLAGSSGRSTGPHLHYEVRLNGVPVNPIRYVRK